MYEHGDFTYSNAALERAVVRLLDRAELDAEGNLTFPPLKTADGEAVKDEDGNLVYVDLGGIATVDALIEALHAAYGLTDAESGETVESDVPEALYVTRREAIAAWREHKAAEEEGREPEAWAVEVYRKQAEYRKLQRAQREQEEAEGDEEAEAEQPIAPTPKPLDAIAEQLRAQGVNARVVNGEIVVDPPKAAAVA